MNEDADVQKTLGDVVLYKIDAEKDPHGPEYAKLQSVHGYPTFVVLNAKGQPINRWMGYEKSFFSTKVTETLADPTTIDEKEARFAASPTAKDAALLAGYAGSRGDYKQCADLYRRADDLAGPGGADHAMDIFEAVFDGSRQKQPVFTTTDVKDAATKVLDSKSHSPEDLISLTLQMSSLAEHEAPGFLVPYLKAAEASSRDTTDVAVARGRRQVMPLYALQVEKDPDKAVAYEKAMLPDGWMNDAGQLNRFAWWCFENQVDLAEAKTLAAKGAGLAAPGKEKAMILDTEAELCNSLKDCRDSVELSRQAMQEDPDNAYYRDQLARFEKLLAKES